VTGLTPTNWFSEIKRRQGTMNPGDYFWEEKFERVVRLRAVFTEEYTSTQARRVYVFNQISPEADPDVEELFFYQEDVLNLLEPLNAMEVLARVRSVG